MDGTTSVNVPDVNSTTPVVEPLSNTTPATKSDGNKSVGLEELFQHPEFKAFIESVRRQEKDKLYKTLETKENETKELTKLVEQLKAQLKDKENQNLSEVELLQNQVRTLTEALDSLKDSIEAEREAAKAEKRAIELNAYKERRLREVGPKIVVNLVGGNSEEEIDASIEIAKQEYQRIAEEAINEIKANNPPTNNISRVTNPPANGNSPTTYTSEQIRKMSKEEWSKVRESVLKQVSSLRTSG